MARSNVKYELAGTKKPNFSGQHVLELKNRVLKRSSFWSEILLTSLPIILYFVASPEHLICDGWTFEKWDFPLSATVCNIYINLGISALLRCVLECYNGQKRVTLSWENTIPSVIPPGIATGFTIGLSSCALTMLISPVYIMTQSTTIVHVLAFSLLFQLERKSWSLTGIVMMIFVGLAMFVYKSTELNRLGISIALLASFFHGLQMTMIQHAMQKSKLGLENAIDMMYYILPWMLLSTIPFAIWFEGSKLYDKMLNTDWSDNGTTLMITMAILGKYLIVFWFQLAQFMIISRTSSLTLCIAGIFKTLCTIILLFEREGTLMSNINFLGLLTCFAGIILYIIVRPWTTKIEENEEMEGNSNSDVERDSMISKKSKIVTISGIFDNEKWMKQ